VKSAREPLRFPATGCMLAPGTGAARAGSATSGQSPLNGHNTSTEELPPAPDPGSPRRGGTTWCGRSQGRSKRSACLHGGSLRGRPRRTALSYFEGEMEVVGGAVAPSSPLGDLRDVP
jgi:hypothetical protein